MTKFLFVRHGEADYHVIKSLGLEGPLRDFAPLSEKGVNQIIETSKSDEIKGIDIIVSSPCTRALQSASILSKELGKPLVVEVGLHEWIPDRVNYDYKTREKLLSLYNDYKLHNGVHPCKETKVWETTENILNRVHQSLDKYREYKSVLVVSHQLVITAISKKENVLNGEIITVKM